MTRCFMAHTMARVACVGCIMVVDDDGDTREALRDYVERLGCRVVVARDGLEAWDSLHGCSWPCLVLLDLNMPRLDGEGFLRRVRAEAAFSDLVVASMTAEHHRSRPDRMAAHLEKPFALHDLDHLIRRHCRDTTLTSKS